MRTVRWTKCAGGHWCELAKVNLAAVTTVGPFIVWVGNQRPRAIRIGYGPIAELVRAQRHDNKVLGYRTNGTVYVTWAALALAEGQGAMVHLHRALRPFITDPLPRVGAVEVNLPWVPAPR